MPAFRCPCGYRFPADAAAPGARLSCPHCGRWVELPTRRRGVAVLAVSRSRPERDVMRIDAGVLGFDVGTFVVAYGIAIGAAFLPLEPAWPKWIVAVVLLGIYAWYVKRHFDADPETHLADLAPLRFHRLDRQAHLDDPAVPRLRVVNFQVLAALGLIVAGATAFFSPFFFASTGSFRRDGLYRRQSSRRGRTSCGSRSSA